MTKREMIDSLMKEFNKVTGHDPVAWRTVDGRNVSTVGTFVFDGNIGGYHVEQIDNEGGGVSCPFGYERYSQTRFIQHLKTAIAAAQINVKGV